MKKTFEIQEVYDPEEDRQFRALIIDGVLFDFGFDMEEVRRAKRICGQDSFLGKSLKGDICQFFLESLSEFLEQPITLAEVNAAIKKGYWECT
jgi:hypothetical protein